MSFDLVLFGGTGDLTWRKLMPSLFQAWRHGKLPSGGRILAVARDDRDDASYRTWLHERLQAAESAKRPTEDEYTQFAQRVHYLRMDLSQAADYARLSAWLGTRPGGVPADTVVMYLATSPHLFPVICERSSCTTLFASATISTSSGSIMNVPSSIRDTLRSAATSVAVCSSSPSNKSTH